MLNTLQAASSLVVRAAIALFTAVVLLLIQSAFWSSRVSLWMQAIVVAIALLSYFRPRYGLLALAVLVPLAQVGSRTLDSTMRGGEALALAFLAGVLIRTWTLRGFRAFPAFPSTRLETAALIFGIIVAASCAEQIWFLQVQRDYPWTFVEGLMAYASREYITRAQGFGMIFRAMLLLEGMALVVMTARCVRQQPSFAQRLTAALIVGAFSTALLTIGSVGWELLETGAVRTRLQDFLVNQRWTVHVSDINAAGSFFVMGMFIALGMAWRDRSHSYIRFGIAMMLAIATWMTHSRTAVAAAALVFVVLAAISAFGRRFGTTSVIAVASFFTIVSAVALWNYLPKEFFRPGAANAIEIRWLFLGTTWRMLLAEPLFGMGIGQYVLWSFHFAAPELLKYYQRQNAHNNFAQIAGELGVVGFVSFVAVIVCALWRKREGPEHVVVPVLLGLAAFILTWLGGHPLLIPEVSIPFWIALGFVAAFARTDIRAGAHAMAAAFILVALLVSLPLRLQSKASAVDFSRVNYGLSARNIMAHRATVFVPVNNASVEIPVRSRAASDDDPVYVDVLVDRSPAGTITLTHRDWQRPHVQLPAGSERRFHEIELRIRRTESPVVVDDDRLSVEVGTWEIISKPNG